MGNQLIKGYDIDKNPNTEGGHESLWSIHKGKRQDSSKNEVSIFMLEKKKLDSKVKNKEEIYQFMRKEASTLIKFKHPQVLSILEPFQEDKTTMGFVTENIEYSLQYLLSRNMVSEIYQSELELKMHINEILNALSFFHNDAKFSHLGLSPENIYVTNDGKWKLGGMIFSYQLLNNQNNLQANISWLQDGIVKQHPNLNFTAPEILLRMINYDHQSRISIQEIQSCQWLNDPFILTLKHLETLHEKDLNQQQTFIKGLNKIILQFEPKVVKKRVLPHFQEIIKIDQLSSLVIQIMLTIIQDTMLIKVIDYQKDIFPLIKKMANAKEMPAQTLFLLVNNLKIFSSVSKKGFKFSYFSDDIQDVFLPLALKCFECGVQKLQLMVLKNTEHLVQQLEYLQIKNKIFPRVLSMSQNENLELRKGGIMCLKQIFNIFDRSIINEQILPALDKARKMGTDSVINMLILQIYEGIAQIVGIDIIAGRVIPQIIPHLADQTLTKYEFNAYLSTTRKLLQKIEEDRKSNFDNIPGQEDFDMDKLQKEIEQEEQQQQEAIKQAQQQQKIQSTSDFDFLSMFEQEQTNPTNNLQNYKQKKQEEDFFSDIGQQTNKNFTSQQRQQTNDQNHFTDMTYNMQPKRPQDQKINSLDEDYFSMTKKGPQQIDQNKNDHDFVSNTSIQNQKQHNIKTDFFQGTQIKNQQVIEQDFFADIMNTKQPSKIPVNQPKSLNLNKQNSIQKQELNLSNMNNNNQNLHNFQQNNQNKWEKNFDFDDDILKSMSQPNVQTKKNDDPFKILNNNQQQNKKVNKSNPWENNDDFDLI